MSKSLFVSIASLVCVRVAPDHGIERVTSETRSDDMTSVFVATGKGS